MVTEISQVTSSGKTHKQQWYKI